MLRKKFKSKMLHSTNKKFTRVKYYSTKFKAKGHYISYSLYITITDIDIV